MKYRVNIRGVMIPNDYKWFYDLFGEESTCPMDVQKVLDAFQDGDEIEVYINSPGGVIDVGSEIYTLLRSKKDHVSIYIVGEACSAASIAAMAAHCEMSPTALMMVHCVSSGVRGNHSDMEHMAEVLRTADKALSTAYSAKSGMSESEALEMMEHETWLTAEKAKELGLIDGIMFDDSEPDKLPLTAGPLFSLPDKDMLEKARRMMEQGKNPQEDEDLELQKLQFQLLNLKGEV